MEISQTRLYRLLVPKFIRKKIDAERLKNKIFHYYSTLPQPLPAEVKQAIDYLKHHPVSMFPHPFQDQYHSADLEVHYDKDRALPFVLMDNKRLYFKSRLKKRRIQKIYNELLKEQDPVSPHCYEDQTFRIEKGDVLVDVGAAEGNFSLSSVELAERIIIFEGDREWIAPLEATFSPWKEKVTIVNKFVGDLSNEDYTTLDDYFSPNEKLSFLKIDVEGAESQLLNGCKRILSYHSPLKVALCTYHKPADEKTFNELLIKNGFDTTFSENFILLFRDRKMEAPFFRRGLIRARKG